MKPARIERPWWRDLAWCLWHKPVELARQFIALLLVEAARRLLKGHSTTKPCQWIQGGLTRCGASELDHLWMGSHPYILSLRDLADGFTLQQQRELRLDAEGQR